MENGKRKVENSSIINYQLSIVNYVGAGFGCTARRNLSDTPIFPPQD
jgi:hypothetical protein